MRGWNDWQSSQSFFCSQRAVGDRLNQRQGFRDRPRSHSPVCPGCRQYAFEVTVKYRAGRLVGNYSLSHANDPLVLLVEPGMYRVGVSAGYRGTVRVPPRGALTSGDEAHVLVSIYDHGRCKVR
jgi:hypothetical protein